MVILFFFLQPRKTRIRKRLSVIQNYTFFVQNSLLFPSLSSIIKWKEKKGVFFSFFFSVFFSFFLTNLVKLSQKGSFLGSFISEAVLPRNDRIIASSPAWPLASSSAPPARASPTRSNRILNRIISTTPTTTQARNNKRASDRKERAGSFVSFTCEPLLACQAWSSLPFFLSHKCGCGAPKFPRSPV